jgi:lipopolysaccharide export system protein LptA
MINLWQKYLGITLSVAVLTAVPLSMAQAQTRATPAAPTGFRFSAPRTIYRTNGVRLEGTSGQLARVQSSQIDVTAQVIAFDYANNRITAIRAQRNVSFKLNTPGAQNVRVEAQTNEATFDPILRNGQYTLVLRGNVRGFYEIGGARNTLQGENATLRFGKQAAQDLTAEVSGGTEGVRLVLPSAASASNGLLTGTVTIQATRATVNQKEGVGRFIGNARAFSNDGANKFDVRAPEFVVTLGNVGGKRTFNGLSTTGRTSIVMDLPEPPAGNTATSGSGSSNVGRLTHVEVSADSATALQSDQSLVLQGNVQGFYRLAGAAAGADQRFTGNKAVIRNIDPKDATEEMPAGLFVDVTGLPDKPVVINFPGLDLGLGD